MANVVDPRVDSDRSQQYNGQGTYGNNQGGFTGQQGNYGQSGVGTNNYDNPASTNTAGPHRSDMANRVDPRVDSDRSQQYGGQQGAYGNGPSHLAGQQGNYGSQQTTGNQGGFDPAYNNPASTNTAGPHRSDMVNKLDPRVDSDRSQGFGGQQQQTGQFNGQRTGAYENTQSTNHGPHSTNVGNAMDPRIDSDRSKQTGQYNQYNDTQNSNYGATGAYDNPASSNYGPHSSNLANKLDPRVDSAANQAKYTY